MDAGSIRVFGGQASRWAFRSAGFLVEPQGCAPRGKTARMDIAKFLQLMMAKGASDMFLTAGAPIQMKIEGVMYPLGNLRCRLAW